MTTFSMRTLFGWPLVFIAAALGLSLLAAFNQVKAMGLSWQEEHYLPQLEEAAQRTGYGEEGEGPFSAALTMAVVRAKEAAGVPRATGVAMAAMRVVQNLILLLVVYGYCRALGLSPYTILLGWMALAWAMTNAAWNTTLAFDVYTEAILCVSAAWAVAAGRATWAVPMALLAALNRETGWLIPLTVIAATVGAPAPTGVSSIRRYAIALACALAYAAGAMALWSGYRPEVQGNALLMANLESPRAWGQLAATFSALPLLAIWGWAKSPLLVQCLTALVMPVTFIWHFTHSPVAATHVFMLPLSLCVLPMALFALERYSNPPKVIPARPES